MIFFIDVETTVFNPFSDSVIACGIATHSNAKIFYARPDSDRYGGEHIHKIDQKTALGFDDQNKTCISMLDFMNSNLAENKAKEAMFAYHSNNAFDWRMVEAMFWKVDLVFEFRKIFISRQLVSTIATAKERVTSENYKLNTLCKMFNIELDHHNALSDAIATRKLYEETKTSINKREPVRSCFA